MNHYTTEQFEVAALMHSATIREIKKPIGVITEMVGYVSNVKVTWDHEGRCFRDQKRVKEFDLKFVETPKYYVPSSALYDLTIGRKYPIQITWKGFHIIDDKGHSRYMCPVIKEDWIC